MTAVFGAFITDWQVENAVTDHLREWMPDYICHAQRSVDAALEARGLDPLSANLPEPKSYPVTPREPDKWPEDHLPAIMVVSTGMLETPRKHGNVYKGIFSLGVASICAAGTEEMSKLFAGAYFAAAAQILLDKPSLGGFAEGTTFYGPPEFDWLSGERNRSLASRYCVFAVQVDGIFDITGGPDDHIDDCEDPGDHPTVLTHELELEKL